MDRTDGPCVAVMPHSCNLAECSLFKIRICYDHCKRGVAGKTIFDHLDTLLYKLRRTAECFSILSQKTCYLFAALCVIDISQCIQCNHRTNLQIPDLHSIAADAGLHAAVHTGNLANGGATPCSKVAVVVVWLFRRLLCCRVSHGLIRTHKCISYR